LEIVKELANDDAVNVNWIGEEKGDTPLHRASRLGHLEIAKVLLAHPEIEVSQGNKGDASPFFIACQIGRKEMVSLLLADPRVDPNKPDVGDTTPFFMACRKGHKGVVSLMLAYPRIDPNKPTNDQTTPMWQASQEGHLVVVQLLLASGTEIDTRTRSTFNNKTAAEQARAIGGRTIKPEDETEEAFLRRQISGPLCADMIDESERDPVAVRNRLRCQPGLREYYIGHLFALLIFHSDNFVVINERTAPSDTRRFFRITSRLPLDLQMALCNRAFRSPKDIVLSRDSEPYFQCLGRSGTWQ